MVRAHNDKQAERFFEHGIHATGAVTIMRPVLDLYQVWRELTDLPRFIDRLEFVQVLDEKRSRWSITGARGRRFTWEAEVINEEPGALLAWKTVGEPAIPNAGSIRFRELAHGRGTEVKVSLEYLPPGRALGEAIARALGQDARARVHEALHRFRQLMETGEIPTSQEQPVGRWARRRGRPGERGARRTDADVRDLSRAQRGGLEIRP